MMSLERQQKFVLAFMLTFAAIMYVLVNHFRAPASKLTSHNQAIGANSPRQLNMQLPSVNIQQLSVEYVPPPMRAEVVPEIEGKALGKLVPFNLGDKPSSTAFAPPTPEIWLAFPIMTEDSTVINVQLPSEVKGVLREHWQAACAHYYSESTGENARLSRVERKMVLADVSAITLCKLYRLSINAPGGKRLISKNEAVSIVSRLNIFAKDLLGP